MTELLGKTARFDWVPILPHRSLRVFVQVTLFEHFQEVLASI